ncbi:DUF6415 family natural product biosynthesis protein [Streptomyces indiaensis]|uniref:Uncharacterized protein n=1 Tax=Streptomyces indiaensis TaxID=284033 RepID=A0ABN3D458_9ACTN|nr:DUF6415 family natural product biosynthesis protein [Streptomyces indiaensis]MCF1645477.1 DUF6415 family natural product biosynthesis protein [Streptomyces indiaensis]
MRQATALARAAAEHDQAPPDVATMRETAHSVLGPDNAPEATPPAGDELETLTVALRGHLELLAPAVEQAAGRLPEDAPTRTAALACVAEARGKLRAPELGFAGLAGSVMYARRLARVLDALCGHYETASADIEKSPVQAAFDRLAEHCLRCPTCRTVDEQGAHAGLPCDEESRLHEAYRAARAHAAAVRLAQRRAEDTA